MPTTIPRLIAADMDDTLLNSHHELSPRTLSALQLAMEKGVKVVLASGRMIESMLPSARSIAPNAPMIAYNGGVICDAASGEILHADLIPVDDARQLCEVAEQMGIHVQAYQDGSYFFNEDNAFSEGYAASIKLRGQAVHKRLSEWIDKGQHKLLLIDTPERIQEIRPIFVERFKGILDCITSKPSYLECTLSGVDKGGALKVLCEMLGVDASEAVAFGDGQNDLGMLKFVGRGYAMSNAGEAVRREARFVAPSNDEDGVAQMIEEWFS